MEHILHLLLLCVVVATSGFNPFNLKGEAALSSSTDGAYHQCPSPFKTSGSQSTVYDKNVVAGCSIRPAL